MDAARPASASCAARVFPRFREGLDRRRDEPAGNGDLDQHVGAGVLHGLERADQAAELLPDLHVGDGGGEHRLRDAEAVAGESHRGAVAQPPDGAGRRSPALSAEAERALVLQWKRWSNDDED
jgi:hypothetical protein